MNIIQWFKQKAGKVPVSVMQAAGVGAVVAVAGFGAYQYLTAPEENNNAFTPSPYNEEVVYVAGANGGNYGANGELQSAFRAAPSRAIQLTEQQALAEKRAEALRESGSYYDGSQQVASAGNGGVGTGYEFGATSNLGMGGDKGAEAEGGMEAFGQAFSGIQDMIKNQTAAAQQAADGAGAAAQAQAEGGLAGAAMAGSAAGQALASMTHNWGQSAAKSGNNISATGVNNEFSVQDSGKNVQAGAPVAAGDFNTGAAAGDDPALALNGKFSNFGRDRNAYAKGGRTTGKGGEELEQMRKQSADIANNQFRAANEPGSIFLAGNRLSGGLRVDSGDMPTTGTGTSSGAFDDPYSSVNKGGIKDMAQSIDEYADKVELTQKEYEADLDDLQKDFWIMLAAGIGAMIAIPIIINIAKAWGPWAWLGYVLALIPAGLALWRIIEVWQKGSEIYDKWHDNPLITYSDFWNVLGKVVGGLMTLGIGLAFIKSSALMDFYKSAWQGIKEFVGNAWGSFKDWMAGIFGSGAGA